MHAEGTETWEMASGAATIVGPDSVVVALAPDGPGRAATADVVAHAAAWGARIIEVGPTAPGPDLDPPRPARRRRRGPRSPHRRAADRAPRVRAGPPARARSRPARLGRALSQPGSAPHRGSLGSGRIHADRVHRRRFRGVHAQPPGRHPVVPGTARRGDRPPRHRCRPPPDRGTDGGLRGHDPRRHAHRARPTSTVGRPCPAPTSSSTRSRSAARPPRGSTSTSPPATACATRSTTRSTWAASSVDCGRSRSSSGSSGTWRSSVPTPGSSTTRIPMAILVRAVAARSQVRTVGLCHSVYWTIHALGEYMGIPPDEIQHVTAGVNHLAWVLRLERDGVDLYPTLRAAVDAGRVPPDDLVRAELYRRFGFYPTESSEHHAEYNPWFIPKGDLVERFNIPIGEYLDRVATTSPSTTDTMRRLDAGEPFEIERSGEYAAVIAHALATGERGTDRRQRHEHDGLIPNLADDACVEVPCDVDGSGVHPIATGPLPASPRRLRPSRRRHPGARGHGRPRRGPRPHLPRGPVRPAGPGRPDARRGMAHDRRAHRGRSPLAAGMAGRQA